MRKPIETSARGASAQAPRPLDPADPSGSSGIVCAEYTPELQIEILGLELARLEPPILDLGCGASASLVRHLRAHGAPAVIGLDPRAPEGVGFVRASWFEVSFPPGTWRSVLAHQSFSLHFLRAHLSSESEAARFARKYMELLRSLEAGGCFFYAPGLPFVEQHLDPAEFAVVRRPLPVASVPGAARDLVALYGSEGLYAARVERVSRERARGGTS
jgi:hypothetical protein